MLIRYYSYIFKDFIKLILGILVKNQCGILENNRQRNITFSPICQETSIAGFGMVEQERQKSDNKRAIEREGD